MSAAPPVPEPLLLDYAAGSASPAIGLLVATHLAMSEESRKLFAMMEGLGGALLETLDDEPLDRISARAALREADGDRPAPDPWPAREALSRHGARPGTPASFRQEDLPAPLRAVETEIGGDRRWRRLGFGVAARRLPLAGGRERAHLLWAKGGTGIADHRHVGREAVLILKGAFWDGGVRYDPGDVALCEDGTVHGPKIDDGEDCLCLAVTEAPVHFTGIAGLILNRFCRF